MIGLVLLFRRWFNVKGVPLPGGPDREADLVAVADEPDEKKPAWLLIFEVQSQHDAAKPRVLLLEASVFLCYAQDTEREGGPFRPLPVFVYLTGKCPTNAVAIRTPTGCGFQCDPALWEVGEDSAEQTLAKVEADELPWGALFWVSLMKGADKEGPIGLWRRLLDEKVPRRSRADVAYVASLFAELTGRWVAWNRVVGDVNMTESVIANSMIELGQMRATRATLLEFIKGRFPEALTTDVERAIADQPSLDLLREWVAAAARARTAEEFLEVLRH